MKKVDARIPSRAGTTTTTTTTAAAAGAAAASQPLSLRRGNIASLFFYVLRKSCGEITRARSPPFVTDGKPFRRDYDAPDLLSFPFLLKPRYQ